MSGGLKAFWISVFSLEGFFGEERTSFMLLWALLSIFSVIQLRFLIYE